MVYMRPVERRRSVALMAWSEWSFMAILMGKGEGACTLRDCKSMLSSRRSPLGVSGKSASSQSLMFNLVSGSGL